MKASIDNGRCLVSGAATGIGAATAIEYASNGWQVGVMNVGESTREAALEVVRRCLDAGGDALVIDCDVRDDQACTSAVQRMVEQFGGIDVLVNSAGTTRFVPHADLDAMSAEEFRRIYDVNLIGMFQLTRACTPSLRASSAGAVVNLSSLAALVGKGSSIAYAASKGAVNTLTLSLARSLAPSVRVNAIAPGMVDEGLPAHVLGAEAYAAVLAMNVEGSALKRFATPAEIAAMAWFLGACAPSMTGSIILMDNGLHLL
jgi:NAD(P)-dependent dehydrogenase (short-subunit alcohol dehydrogenase family)